MSIFQRIKDFLGIYEVPIEDLKRPLTATETAQLTHKKVEKIQADINELKEEIKVMENKIDTIIWALVKDKLN